MTNEYNDLWELDRGDYVSIITELRAALAEAERERDEARAEAGEWRNMAVSVADQIEKSAGINSAGYAEYVRDRIAICETILAERQQAERGQAGKE